MEQLKTWAREEGLLNDDSIILGIAQDNPKFTEPKDCRYDTCLVVSNEFEVDSPNINFGNTIGGNYCIFTINHTTDAIEKAWMEIFSELSKINCEPDYRKPIIERYSSKMISKDYCEICVPIL